VVLLTRAVVINRAIPAIERLLIAAGTGVIALLVLVNIIGFLAERPMSEVNAAHLEALGNWLLPIYAAGISLVAAGIPLGVICGFLCGTRPPSYSLAAAAVITLPFMVSHFDDPSVYCASLVVSLAHYMGCIAGARARQVFYPSPILRWSGAQQRPPASILSTDVVLFGAFVFLATSVHALASGRGTSSSVAVAFVFTVGMLIARCRLRVATDASAA
jgi:hypothetical protein